MIYTYDDTETIIKGVSVDFDYVNGRLYCVENIDGVKVWLSLPRDSLYVYYSIGIGGLPKTEDSITRYRILTWLYWMKVGQLKAKNTKQKGINLSILKRCNEIALDDSKDIEDIYTMLGEYQ